MHTQVFRVNGKSEEESDLNRNLITAEVTKIMFF